MAFIHPRTLNGVLWELVEQLEENEPMSEDGRPTACPFPNGPMLRGERVWLRPLEERDMAAYVGRDQ